MDQQPSEGTRGSASIVERFRASMVCDYEKWHDGIGYDVVLLASASPDERSAIEALLLQRGVEGWRDVEALAALDSPRARERLRRAMTCGNAEVRAAVMRYASGLVSAVDKTAALVAALETAEVYGGLTQALLEVEQFHPPEVVEALLRGTILRDGATAVHFAAMLMFVHGKAKSSFDWGLRPFFLKFNTEERSDRAAAFRELCRRLGISPEPYLAG
jgi:hypothetical protein